MTALQAAGLSHSDTAGSKVICTSPAIIAAYRVLHRLREPRHPPCALSYFLSRNNPPKEGSSYFQLSCVKSSARIPLKQGEVRPATPQKAGCHSLACAKMSKISVISRFHDLQSYNCQIVKLSNRKTAK